MQVQAAMVDRLRGRITALKLEFLDRQQQVEQIEITMNKLKDRADARL